MTIDFSRGKNIRDNKPQRRSVEDFAALVDALDGDRAAVKDTAGYVCGPLNSGGTRGADGALPVQFLALDFDRIADAETLIELRGWLTSFSGCAWATHSSTPSQPRERVLIELDRPAKRPEVMAIGAELAATLSVQFGERIEIDPSTFRPEQPLFLPPPKVTLARFLGDALDVDKYLAAQKARRGASDRPQDSDPAADLLRDIEAGKSLHESILRVVARLAGKGLDRDTIKTTAVGLLERARRVRGGRVDQVAAGELDRMIDGALKKYAPKPAESYVLHSVASLRAQPAPPWLILDLLPARGLCVLYGEPGSGKSFLALDLAAHITRKRPWANRRTRHAKVVYVALEGHMRNRIDAYQQHHGLTDDDLADLLVVQSQPLNLLDAATVPQLVADIRRELGDYAGDVVVVIDTLARSMPGGNENASEDMGRVIAAGAEIERQLGALVVMVHHAGKDTSKGARGWSGLRGAADCEIVVERDGETRRATFAKVKDGTDGTAVEFELQVIDLGPRRAIDPDAGDHERVTSCVAVVVDANPPKKSPDVRGLGKNQKLLLDALRANGPWTRTRCYEFMLQAGIGKNRTCEALDALLARGFVDDLPPLGITARA